MGMYTEIHFYVDLKKSTPKNVIDILSHITTDSEVTTVLDELKLPEHEFFLTDRWQLLGRCDSFYFPGLASSFVKKREDWCDWYVLNINANLKNYDNEIQKFLGWIHPYVDEIGGACVGYFQYEEDDMPKVIRYRDERFDFVRIRED